MASFYPDHEVAAVKLQEAASAAGVEYIRFTTADIHGIGRGKVVPLRHLRGFLEDGLGVYGGIMAVTPRSHEVDLPSVSNGSGRELPVTYLPSVGNGTGRE